MARKKSIREKGKTRLSRYFQNFKVGDRVSIVRDLGEVASFPRRMQGNTGIIEAVRGKAYIVKLDDYNQTKRYIIKAVHLKRVK